jgi:ornithine cyclodeaminase/alanine dehydrogenase-like protein (mu-crystallin family)
MDMNTEKLKAIVVTYLRAAVASVLALYLAGTTDLKTLALAGVAAVAGPVLKALDPSASEFGVNSK